jgi:hypothetical protein
VTLLSLNDDRRHQTVIDSGYSAVKATGLSKRSVCCCRSCRADDDQGQPYAPSGGRTTSLHTSFHEYNTGEKDSPPAGDGGPGHSRRLSSLTYVRPRSPRGCGVLGGKSCRTRHLVGWERRGR